MDQILKILFSVVVVVESKAKETKAPCTYVSGNPSVAVKAWLLVACIV